jgi:hypothetical protein
MPITITITDGTVTAAPIVIEDARTPLTTAALSAAVGDTAPPANSARAVRAGVARWIATTRRQHRESLARAAADAQLAAALTAISADEPAPA